MNVLTFVFIGLAAIGAFFTIGVLAAVLRDAFSSRAHRLRVALAVREGWAEPRISANWSVVNSGEVATDGVTGIEATPDRGVPVREYARHSRTVQRRVEEAWLAGIAEEKRRERDAVAPGDTAVA